MTTPEPWESVSTRFLGGGRRPKSWKNHANGSMARSEATTTWVRTPTTAGETRSTTSTIGVRRTTASAGIADTSNAAALMRSIGLLFVGVPGFVLGGGGGRYARLGDAAPRLRLDLADHRLDIDGLGLGLEVLSLVGALVGVVPADQS